MSFVCFAVVATASPSSTKGKPDDPRACTVANVAGTHGFTGTGTVLANPFGFPEGAVATVGVLTFDGQGVFSTSQTVSFNAEPTDGLSLTGTYTVNPDCRFTLVEEGGKLRCVRERPEGSVVHGQPAGADHHLNHEKNYQQECAALTRALMRGVHSKSERHGHVEL